MCLFGAASAGVWQPTGELRQGAGCPWLLIGVIALLILVINGIKRWRSASLPAMSHNALVAYDSEAVSGRSVAIYAFCLACLALPIRGDFRVI